MIIWTNFFLWYIQEKKIASMYNIGSNFTSIKITADDQEFNVLVEETYNPNGEPEPSYVVPREIGKYM